MHICFITGEYPKPGYPHGGIGTFVKTLGTALANQGHHVSILVITRGNITEYEQEGSIIIYRIAQFRLRGMSWLINGYKLNRVIRQINLVSPIDVIEAPEAGLAFIKKLKTVRYIVRLHGGHYFFSEAEKRGINRWKAFQERLSLKKADIIVGVGHYVMQHTADYIDFKNKQGPVIYNPINLDKFYEADPGKAVHGCIFFSGTLIEKKGIRQLINALPLIKKEISAAHLVIAGRDSKLPDGSSYVDWLKQGVSDQILESIKFLGPVANDEIPGLIEKAEVCVFPSHMETFGIAAAEAMAMAKPVVFTKLGPGPEVIRHGITGLLCDPYNPQDIADKVLEILKNPNFGISLGLAARQDVAERFSITTLLKQNILLYKSVLKN
ncbi:MAG: glycosyltransferase family 4 protein [Bacteroidales bacterium]